MQARGTLRQAEDRLEEMRGVHFVYFLDKPP